MSAKLNNIPLGNMDSKSLGLIVHRERKAQKLRQRGCLHLGQNGSAVMIDGADADRASGMDAATSGGDDGDEFAGRGEIFEQVG